VVIYVTATPAPIAALPTLPQVEATPEPTSLFASTPVEIVTFRPLPSATKAPTQPATRRPPTLTLTFTPEFTDTPPPKATAAPTSDPKRCAATFLTPNGFTTLYNGDKAVQTALGCPQSSATAVSSASIQFENGQMIWVSSFADQPRKVIYVMFNNGTFLRVDDTWIEGVDPAQIGESAPAGKKAPIRGFGKVWKTAPNARNGLGWALTDEAGTSGQIQRFERGELIFVAGLNQLFVLADGRWQAKALGF
jgi:hypothetical protein